MQQGMLRAACLLGLLPAADAIADEMQELLEKHNSLRCMHGAPPLEWDAKVATGAQEWASSGSFESSDTDLGENMAWGHDMTGVMATQFWYDEIDMTSPRGKVSEFDAFSGHYTQLVWNETRKIGCGKGTVHDRTLWVCRYSPPGNIDDQFDAQVSAATKSETTCSLPQGNELKTVVWSMKDSTNGCSEQGTIQLTRKTMTVGDRPEAAHKGEYDVVGFSVDSTEAGVPVGSTVDGTYSFKKKHGETLKFLSDPVQGKVSFGGTGATAAGSLKAETTLVGDGFEIEVSGTTITISGLAQPCSAPVYLVMAESSSEKDDSHAEFQRKFALNLQAPQLSALNGHAFLSTQSLLVGSVVLGAVTLVSGLSRRVQKPESELALHTAMDE